MGARHVKLGDLNPELRSEPCMAKNEIGTLVFQDLGIVRPVVDGVQNYLLALFLRVPHPAPAGYTSNG